MAKLLKNSSSQSLNVIYIKNIFINPMLNLHNKIYNDFPLINNKSIFPFDKHTTKTKHYERYSKRKEDIDSELLVLKKILAKTLYSKLNSKKTRNIKEINKSCLNNISQKNLVAVGYRFKPQVTNRNSSFVVYKNKSCSNSRLKM